MTFWFWDRVIWVLFSPFLWWIADRLLFGRHCTPPTTTPPTDAIRRSHQNERPAHTEPSTHSNRSPQRSRVVFDGLPCTEKSVGGSRKMWTSANIMIIAIGTDSAHHIFGGRERLGVSNLLWTFWWNGVTFSLLYMEVLMKSASPSSDVRQNKGQKRDCWASNFECNFFWHPKNIPCF